MSPRRFALFALAVASPASAAKKAGKDAVHHASCAACSLVTSQLERRLNSTRDELEASKQFNDKKAASIDRVQKAQTKRWLKNEYGVALRAGLEEELEQVCASATMVLSRELSDACAALLEEHEDALVRGVLDGERLALCYAAIAGCTAGTVDAAVERFKRDVRSAPKPTDAERFTGTDGAVRRVVGDTFANDVLRVSSSTLVMLFSSAAEPAGQPTAADQPLVAQFYAIAAAANASDSGSTMRFAQLDLRLNELPMPLELPAVEGPRFLFYGAKRSRGDAPKLLPDHGDPSLLALGGDALRLRLGQWLIPFLSTKEASAWSRAAKGGGGGAADETPKKKKKKQKEKAKEAPAPTPTQAEAAAGEERAFGKPPGSSPPPPKAAPPRAKPKKKTADERAARKQMSCEVCGQLMRAMVASITQRKDEMELSKEAADRKAAAIDAVQKAQTKRWLKQEYAAGLAAALEERLDGICAENGFEQRVCGVESKAIEGSALRAAAKCESSLRERCEDLLGDHAEEMMRAALDGSDAEVCPKLVGNGCELDDAMRFASGGVAPAEDPPPDDPSVVEPPRPRDEL